MTRINFKVWPAVFTVMVIVVANQLAFPYYKMLESSQKRKIIPPAPASVAVEAVSENYFPLRTGNYWVYRATVEIGNDKGGTDKINKPRRVQVISANGDDKQRIVQLRNEDYNGSNLITYSIRGGKVHRFDEFDKPGAEKQIDLPDDKLRYSFPLSEGKRWGEEDKVSSRNGLYCYVVEAQEDVTVPAGAFHDCYRIAFRTIADESVEWFVPSVGIVKSTYHHNGTVDDELYELEAYKVGAEARDGKTKTHSANGNRQVSK